MLWNLDFPLWCSIFWSMHYSMQVSKLSPREISQLGVLFSCISPHSISPHKLQHFTSQYFSIAPNSISPHMSPYLNPQHFTTQHFNWQSHISQAESVPFSTALLRIILVTVRIQPSISHPSKFNRQTWGVFTELAVPAWEYRETSPERVSWILLVRQLTVSGLFSSMKLGLPWKPDRKVNLGNERNTGLFSFVTTTPIQ